MPVCPELMSTPVCAFAGSPGYLPAARVGSHGTIHVHGNRIRSNENTFGIKDIVGTMLPLAVTGEYR